MQTRRPSFTISLFVLFAGIVTVLSACSPLYVLEAGLTEGGILFRRQPIAELVSKEDLEQDTRAKFELVLAARDFASKIGLKPKGSFEQYSTVETDVLVWVLSASPKSSLTPYTWWFPIVGSFPYKGFFDREDALGEEQKLLKKGLDTFLRPSAAFSTLGWFDDPLLSTMMRFDNASLVNTVIHEILHNTIWINNHVPFNESLANVVGSLGAEQFFVEREGESGPHVVQIRAEWHDELIFADFVEKLHDELVQMYDDAAQRKLTEPEIIEWRREIGLEAERRWKEIIPSLRTNRFHRAGLQLNNAAIIAHRTYLTSPRLFMELFEQSGRSLPAFFDKMTKLVEGCERSKKDPYQALTEFVEAGRAPQYRGA